ncbi:MAG: class I SAM-dependent DNA methyltransferase [Candidatus Latescibacterota bacterium]
MTDDKIPQAPYQGLAPIYDYVMRHVDYDEWADYVQSLLERWAPEATQIADLACGTGNISLELRRLGYEMTGVDISGDMLRVANGKAGGDGGYRICPTRSARTRRLRPLRRRRMHVRQLQLPVARRRSRRRPT